MLRTITEIAALIIALGGATTVVYRSWRIIDTKIDRVLYELSDNSGGSFKDWAKAEFQSLGDRMTASEADRRDLRVLYGEEIERVKAVEEEVRANREVVRERGEVLEHQFADEIARTKRAREGHVDDRGRHTG